jgi:arylsulfatase B
MSAYQSRRHFLRIAAGTAAMPAFLANPSQAAARPNIVVMVADDAGWADFGFHGSNIATPNLDRLVQTGKELNRFYVEPVCSPTRASLMTGAPSSRVGIQSPLQTYSKHGLPPQTITIAECLKRSGYDTCISGKWHLGMQPDQYPGKFGFRHSYGYVGPWLDSWTHQTTNFGEHDEAVDQWHRNGELVNEQGEHVTDLIAEEAVRFITTERDPAKPFFLYVPFSAPHTPIQEDDRWVEPYKNTISSQSRRYYAAAMTHMDHAIGQIQSALEQESIADNTLVIFFSDNGGARGGTYTQWLRPPARQYMSYGKTDVLADNKPLRGWKGQMYEGGIRVPAVMHWPGKLKSGVVDAALSVQDIYPTLAGLAGAELPAAGTVEGVDCWPALQGKSLPEDRVIYIQFRNDFAVYKNEWKLIHRGKNPDEGSDELYHLAADPYETTDLARRNPGKLSELKAELQQQYARDM